MDQKTQFAAGWVSTVGILFMVLGVIHCAATPLVMRGPMAVLLPESRNVFLFMFLATGVATFFAGRVVRLAAEGLKKRTVWGWRLAWIATSFLLLLGIGAVIAMLSNPFAHLTLLFALALAFPLWWYQIYLRPMLDVIP